jgi:hypothetical protein
VHRRPGGGARTRGRSRMAHAAVGALGQLVVRAGRVVRDGSRAEMVSQRLLRQLGDALDLLERLGG